MINGGIVQTSMHTMIEM